MVYSNSPSHPSILELAQAGNVQAIALWLNQSLMPYSIRAKVGTIKSGCLAILLELQPLPGQQPPPEVWREYLLRFICHQIWRLNSAQIEGVRLAARFTGNSKMLWEQSARVISPARRKQQMQARQLRTQVHRTSRQRTQVKRVRSLLLGGPAVAAFVVGGALGYSKAPVEQRNAVASPQPEPASPPPRIDRVQAALETIVVNRHQQVQNPADPTVSLLFGGDVTLADAFTDAIGKDYEKAFAEMEEARQADLAMVNLENPLTRATLPKPDKQFNFKADPEMVEVLKQGGIDLVTLANNHTMDYEAEGLVETMKTLDRAGIQYMGAGRDIKEARRPEIVDVKGQRVAYLSYWGDEYSAGENTPGISPIREENIAQDIQAIRNQVDWIVVNYHWGQELAQYPADWQVKLAHFTIDQGADLIVGHHPHVLQGAEIYRGRPIVYSLGNFIFGGNSRSDYDTAVLRVSLNNKQMKAEFLPVEVRGYQAKVVSGDQGAQILQHLSDLSSEFEQPLESPVILDARTSAPVQSPEPSLATPAPESTASPINSEPFSSPEVTPPPIEPTDSAPPSPISSPDAIDLGQPQVQPSSAPEPTSANPDPADPAVQAAPTEAEIPAELPANSTPAATEPPVSPTPSPTATDPAFGNSFTTSPNNTPFKPLVPENNSEGEAPADPQALETVPEAEGTTAPPGAF